MAPQILTMAWFLSLTWACQLPPEKEESSFSVSPGLEIRLWASEPLFVNPTTFDIDPAGRIWVCEAVNYRRKLMGKGPLRAEGDRVVILADSNGDGSADTATTFYQSPALMSPIGIAVAPHPSGKGRKVFLCQSPDILLLEDKDGDDKADGPPVKLLTGFRGIDHDHGVHGISIGPDGRLYFTVGDAGVSDLKSSDGKGPSFTSNAATIRAGTVWRCDLDGKNLELIAHNFRNNYMAAIDSFGNVFLSDNDDDGNQQTRICFVMPGGNYGYHPRGAGQTHWHEEQPGIVPKVLRTYFGSPTGMCFYEGDLLPEKYRGQMLHTDAGPRHVRAYSASPKGAGFEVGREDIVTSTDNWFRPSDVRVAPDGSVFIADWYDPGVGGHGMGDTTRGRIFRLAPPGFKRPVPGPTKATSPDEAVKALASPCLSTRAMALAWFFSRPAPEAAKVARPLATGSGPDWLKARARWVLAATGNLGPNDLTQLDKPALAAQAARIIRDYPGATGLASRLPAGDAGATRELLVGLRDADSKKAGDAILRAAASWDGVDVFLSKAMAIAAGSEPRRRSETLADFSTRLPDWNDRTAALAFELRPPDLAERLLKRLAGGGLTDLESIRIVDFIAGEESTRAANALLGILKPATAPAVRMRAAEALALHLPGKWAAMARDGSLEKSLESLGRDKALASEFLALCAATGNMRGLAMASAIANDESRPVALRERAIATLGKLPWKDSASALRQVALHGGPLAAKACSALGELASARKKTDASDSALEALQALLANDSCKSPALEALANTRAGTQWLLARQESGKLPGNLLAETGRLLRNSPFQEYRNKAMIAFPAPGKIDARKLPSSSELAKRAGNPGRGKALLDSSAKNDLQCIKCHMIDGLGGRIGPDLSQIGKKASRENLLDSLLTPSKAIADQYLVHAVSTKGGLVVSGLLLEETPDALVLRDANGKDHRIPKGEIDERTRLQESIMPANLVAHMSEDDLLDICEHLLTLKSSTMAPGAFRIIGPLEGGKGGDSGFDQPMAPERGLDFKASMKGKGGMVGWRAVRPDSSGYVDLTGLHWPGAADSVSFVAVVAESPVKQKGWVLLGADDCSRLWVNGAMVHEDRAHEAARPAKFRVPVELKAGANTILLKISNGNNPHGFYLSLSAEQELRETTVP